MILLCVSRTLVHKRNYNENARGIPSWYLRYDNTTMRSALTICCGEYVRRISPYPDEVDAISASVFVSFLIRGQVATCFAYRRRLRAVPRGFSSRERTERIQIDALLRWLTHLESIALGNTSVFPSVKEARTNWQLNWSKSVMLPKGFKWRTDTGLEILHFRDTLLHEYILKLN